MFNPFRIGTLSGLGLAAVRYLFTVSCNPVKWEFTLVGIPEGFSIMIRRYIWFGMVFLICTPTITDMVCSCGLISQIEAQRIENPVSNPYLSYWLFTPWWWRWYSFGHLHFLMLNLLDFFNSAISLFINKFEGTMQIWRPLSWCTLLLKLHKEQLAEHHFLPRIISKQNFTKHTIKNKNKTGQLLSI